METGLVADVSIVKAWKGDKEGNLIYRKTARNFNPMMATAGKITVAEVEELVEVGELMLIRFILLAFLLIVLFMVKITKNVLSNALSVNEEVNNALV